MDSSPLEGAGRVEDTINLLAHAGRKIVACAAKLLGWTEERVGLEAGAPLLLESSVKKGLDLNWSDPDEKAEAIPMLLEQLTSLEQWVAERLPEELHRPPLQEHVATLHQIIEQDLEPDPDDPGGAPSRIRQGVAEDRRVSIEDKEMRHGRKTKSKRFNGYKRHLAIDLDTVLVLAVAVLPANRPEQDAAPSLVEDIEAQGRSSSCPSLLASAPVPWQGPRQWSKFPEFTRQNFRNPHVTNAVVRRVWSFRAVVSAADVGAIRARWRLARGRARTGAGRPSRRREEAPRGELRSPGVLPL